MSKNCETDLEERAKFCMNCGIKVELVQGGNKVGSFINYGIVIHGYAVFIP